MDKADISLAFFGASGGCGLFALKKAVAAGYTCIALCRNPSKLEAHFPALPANLIIKPGNAHAQADVAACLQAVPSPSSSPLSSAPRLVDAVYFTIGGAFNAKNFSIDDPDVCRKGITTLHDAIAALRAQGFPGRPLVVVGSTTGISKHKRDVPLMMMPMYSIMLKQPHKDKKAMEDIVVAGPERFVLVRPSFLTDGEKPDRKIRVAVEDPDKGVERLENGYFISREDVGRWVFENLLMGGGAPNQYEGKAVGITW
ncbi:Flavin reductase (NADPH) [Escovopsis weberi]|uniref:Flavin reductase (NADPH) n=1 Tax=Escovopsis weberi TaxID=150374 RepID=A0A0M9VVG7_ESCWE|nr:Flavin reductase (NADPH) [Escovopsis weberi]